jgi:hypothetical protein
MRSKASLLVNLNEPLRDLLGMLGRTFVEPLRGAPRRLALGLFRALMTGPYLASETVSSIQEKASSLGWALSRSLLSARQNPISDG